MENNVYSILRILMTSVGIAGVVYCVFKICGQKIKYKHESDLEKIRNEHEKLMTEKRNEHEKLLTEKKNHMEILKNDHEIKKLEIENLN